jgi:hypothetical protein
VEKTHGVEEPGSACPTAQAAEPSDFDAVLVAVLVVPELDDESDEVEELPESPEDPEVLVEPEPVPELLLEPLPEWLLEPPRRESLRESLR